MDWRDLWAAFAIYLVLEGVLPFLNPGGAKRAFSVLSQLDERLLRRIGLGSMIAGCGVLPKPIRSVSRSTILPLPSSPHWAPMTTRFLDIDAVLVTGDW